MSTEIRWKYDIGYVAGSGPKDTSWQVRERKTPAGTWIHNPELFRGTLEQCQDWIEEQEREAGYAVGQAICSDCGGKTAPGCGIGESAPEEDWPDKSKPRPWILIPLCHRCMGKRLVKQGG